MKKLKLNKQQKRNLPIFYNYISYRKMDSSNFYFHMPESKKYMNFTNISAPNTFISKIIDYSQID
ncbi:hypothetical protein DRF59_10770 [Chryseobacterium flavum]|uniref:Uncharacterized protein n=1 Tax=Chryseobacterium flavum TaxID=415851 RepID=A0A3D9CM32_9FLAO|nr:hypothetical protein DRF59_10770 [Chryseobacterium flavum]